MSQSDQWRPELAKLVPQACQGVFLNNDGLVDLDFFRETLGKAAKYIIQPKYFDYSGPVVGRSFMGVSFIDHPAVGLMVDAFRTWTLESVDRNSSFDRCLRELTLYSRGLSDKRSHRRFRAKRIERLRSNYRRFLRMRHEASPLTSDDRELLRAVTYFLLSIKAQFISRKGEV